MKIALLMNHNSYAGREYSEKLILSNIDFDILSIGEYPEENEFENNRCANLWKPVSFDYLKQNRKCYNFPSLKDESFIEFLKENKYDIGIQGGTGILKPDVIKEFKEGILNFHPGDLPEYRGCCAPEWQIYENRPIVSTCHIVDEGIDTGAIYKKKILDLDYSDYSKIRASIYPQTAKFVAEVIKELIQNNNLKNNIQTQDESIAQYREVMDKEIIEELKVKIGVK